MYKTDGPCNYIKKTLLSVLVCNVKYHNIHRSELHRLEIQVNLNKKTYIDHSQKLFMYSMTPGQDNENEAKLDNFASEGNYRACNRSPGKTWQGKPLETTVVYLRRNGHFKMADGPVCSR